MGQFAANNRRKRLVLVAALAGSLAVGAGVGAWFWFRPRFPDPPTVDLTGADPEAVEAITAARDELRHNPGSGSAWGHLGMVLQAHAFDAEASVCFREAERLDPDNPRWPYFQGLTYVMTDPARGIPFLERAVELCGDHPPGPRLWLAEVLIGQGQTDDAERQLRHVLRRQPDNSRTRLNLARLLADRREWQAALDLLGPCLWDPTTGVRAHQLRAEVYQGLGQPDKAEADLKEAREMPPDRAWQDPFVAEVNRLQRGLEVRLKEADQLKATGRYGEAVARLEETLKRYPRSAQAHEKLGKVWLAASESLREESALPQADKALVEAERALSEAVRLDPESVEGWFSLGVVRFNRNNYEGAADPFRQVVRLKADHGLAHFNLGLCLRKLNDKKAAAAEFRAALRCRPDHAAAREALHELGESVEGP
jgi:tetratricopeptide (TPR) repeat protein